MGGGRGDSEGGTWGARVVGVARSDRVGQVMEICTGTEPYLIAQLQMLGKEAQGPGVMGKGDGRGNQTRSFEWCHFQPRVSARTKVTVIPKSVNTESSF